MILIGNAPCSWGSLEFEDLEGESIGYSRMLDELVETGYRGTELGDRGYMPTRPDELAGELARREVALVGAFLPVALNDAAAHDPGEVKALEIARLLSAVHERNRDDYPPFLVLADDNGADPTRTRNAGRVTADMGMADGQWRLFAQGAQRIARTVRERTGLRTVFHHHCAGYVETPDEIARLLELTDPESLGLVFDTGHFIYGTGSNDAEALQRNLDRFSERIWYIHFKDCHPGVARRCREEGRDYFAAVRDGVFCELGRGCVDFPAVLAWLKRNDYEGWVLVEQDVLPGMGTPKESARRNREYLRSIGV